MATNTTGKKSGMRTLKPGELLFKEKEPANSLYIIQSGQIRLFRPKGRGFVDIAILRSGEVIGEMAYFDQRNKSRSTSAAAIVTTQIIEISFVAFEKTMSGLNPWFKTIINTLADRLRKTNEKVKSLETNSVGFGRGGKVSDYVFFHNADVIKMLSTIYLTTKVHGEEKDGVHQIHMSVLSFYLFEVYAISEIKWEEFIELLKNEHYIELTNDENKLPKLINIKDINIFRSITIFFNSQRRLEDNKKLKISSKCELFLKQVLNQLHGKGFRGNEVHADIGVILDDFKARKVPIGSDDLKDAIETGICGDIIIGRDGNLMATVAYDNLKKTFPSIQLMNSISKINESKKDKKGYE